MDVFWAIVSSHYFPFRAFEIEATIKIKQEELQHWLTFECDIPSDKLLQSECHNY